MRFGWFFLAGVAAGVLAAPGPAAPSAVSKTVKVSQITEATRPILLKAYEAVRLEAAKAPSDPAARWMQARVVYVTPDGYQLHATSSANLQPAEGANPPQLAPPTTDEATIFVPKNAMPMPLKIAEAVLLPMRRDGIWEERMSTGIVRQTLPRWLPVPVGRVFTREDFVAQLKAGATYTVTVTEVEPCKKCSGTAEVRGDTALGQRFSQKYPCPQCAVAADPAKAGDLQPGKLIQQVTYTVQW